MGERVGAAAIHMLAFGVHGVKAVPAWDAPRLSAGGARV